MAPGSSSIRQFRQHVPQRFWRWPYTLGWWTLLVIMDGSVDGLGFAVVGFSWRNVQRCCTLVQKLWIRRPWYFWSTIQGTVGHIWPNCCFTETGYMDLRQVLNSAIYPPSVVRAQKGPQSHPQPVVPTIMVVRPVVQPIIYIMKDIYVDGGPFMNHCSYLALVRLYRHVLNRPLYLFLPQCLVWFSWPEHMRGLDNNKTCWPFCCLCGSFWCREQLHGWDTLFDQDLLFPLSPFDHFCLYGHPSASYDDHCFFSGTCKEWCGQGRRRWMLMALEWPWCLLWTKQSHCIIFIQRLVIWHN